MFCKIYSTKTILLLAAGLVFSLASCNSHPAETQPHDSHAEDVSGNAVWLSDVEMRTASVQMGLIENKNLQTAVKANGMLSVPNDNKALVTSVTNGIVQQLLVQPGDEVKKGQLIARILNPDMAQLQQSYQTTIAQIKLNEIELNRQQELVKGNAAPLKNVERVKAELAGLRAAKNALENQFRLMGIRPESAADGGNVTSIDVKAPISGTVSELQAQIGSKVDASTPIAQIVNNSRLHLDLFVYEKDLPKLHNNQLIHFTLTNNPGKEYDAVIYSIGTAFASESKTIAVHAHVEGDKSGLIEGMNITAVISVGDKLVPAVPDDAIVTELGKDYLFVVTDEKTEKTETGNLRKVQFEKIQIIKGASDVGYSEVIFIKPVAPNARVITKGAFFVNAKITNAGEEQEH